MTRERAKELLPAIEWWANGGDLWFYDTSVKKWYNYEDVHKDVYFESEDPTAYVVGDKHLEARKAYALGKPIEWRHINSNDNWKPVTDNIALWYAGSEYRPAKPKWYEDEKNIGKIVMVRDYDNEKWRVGKFEKFTAGREFPFTVDGGAWKQARLLTEADIVKEPE